MGVAGGPAPGAAAEIRRVLVRDHASETRYGRFLQEGAFGS